ncbi:MAG: 50S ribosomal protein L17 [Planctomycetes bacterium]|nr:50S ribosomal protein L17 [Planctomycetota bacterium]
MRHRRAGRKLGRKTAARIALQRSLINSLFKHGRIQTTLAKAKEYRPRAEKLITLARADSVARRRRAFAILRDAGVVRKLFDEIGPRFRNRPGGYTRILRVGKRRVGDDAPLALFELLHAGGAEEAEAAAPAKAARPTLAEPQSKKDQKQRKAKTGA